MSKSKNRKNHKQKSKLRTERLKQEQNYTKKMFDKYIESLKNRELGIEETKGTDN